jgi:hypothetical protein
MKRMKEIQDRLEKGHLTSDKAQELLDEHDALEKEMKKTTEYRMYLFKKQHGMLHDKNETTPKQKS